VRIIFWGCTTSHPNELSAFLTLQRGVKFHDGTDFDASIVKWNFERMKDPAVGSLRQSEIANIAAVEVVDSHTVKLSLSEPDAALLATLTDRSGMMVSRAAVEQHGKDFARNPVGTGPFQFVEWVKDDHVRIKRYAQYWREGAPLLDEVVYRPIPDPTVRLTAMRAGDLHIIDGVPLQLVSRLKEDPKLTVIETAGLRLPAYRNELRQTALRQHGAAPGRGLGGQSHSRASGRLLWDRRSRLWADSATQLGL
jgi:peptide/nickel transport system substrate-binding protein